MLLPIPADWQQENGYVLALICLPDSQTWRAIVRGKIQELCRGRVWDEKTGSIKGAQAIGWEIYDSFMTCKLDDLVIAVEAINTTLAGLSANAANENNEKVVFELARINYNLDRIRDNLDSFAPDGNEETEYGLATILAALGPNVTRSTEFIRHIKEALNTDLVGIPSESGEFAEGTSPALIDISGEITNFAASMLPGDQVTVSMTVSASTSVKLSYYDLDGHYQLLDTLEVSSPGMTIIYALSDYPDMRPSGSGAIIAIDQKFNIFTDTY